MPRPPLPRWSLLPALALLALLLAACSPIDPTDRRLDLDGAIDGAVRTRSGAPMPADATLVARLRSGETLLGETALDVGGLTPPLIFTLPYDLDAIDLDAPHTLELQIESGGRVIYAPAASIPLFRDDTPSDRLTIDLQAGQPAFAAAVPGALTGVVSWRSLESLPAESVVAVELVDRSSVPFVRIAQQEIDAAGRQPPFSFTLEFDPLAIDPAQIYTLDARVLVDGIVRAIASEPVPVLTGGALADGVELLVGAPEERQESASLSAAPPLVGEVTFPSDGPLPAGARLILEVIDGSNPAYPANVLARQRFDAAGQVSPIPFTIDLVQPPDPARPYLIEARILQEEALLYSSQAPTLAEQASRAMVAVLTQGAPTVGIEIATGAMPTVPTATLDGTLRGTLTYLEAIRLPRDARIDLRLEYVDGADLILVATETQPVSGARPYSFTIAYLPQLIDPEARYTLSAEISYNGRRWFVTEEGIPVLTQGAPATDLALIAEPVIPLDQMVTPTPTQTPTRIPTETPTRTPTPTPTRTPTPAPPPTTPLTAAAPPAGAPTTAPGGVFGLPDATATPIPAAVVIQGTPPALPTLTGPLLSGVVTYAERVALPAGAIVEIDLVNVLTGAINIVAQSRFATEGQQVPIPFSIALPDVPPSALGAFALDARILVDGAPRFLAVELTPVLANGAVRQEIELLLRSGGVPAAQASLPALIVPPVEAPAAPTALPSQTPTPAVQATPTVQATATVQATPTVRVLPTEAQTYVPTLTPTPVPPTPVALPTLAPTATPSPAPTDTPTPLPADGVTVILIAQDAEILPAGAIITAQVRDISTGSDPATVAEAQAAAPGGAGRFALRVELEPAAIDPARSYALFVRVEQNDELIWITGRGFPVLTGGNPAIIEVTLE